MFELKIALKYLIPQKKQRSVALIASMSVGVISLVVWLLLVFLSATEGIERNWLHKLTTLNAPLRITPTAQYYASYYYRIDGIAAASQYQLKSIAAKRDAVQADPYDVEEDGELPFSFPARDVGKDPVRQLFGVLEGLQRERSDLVFQDFELSGALLRLQLLRPGELEDQQSYLTQASYLATLPEKCPHFSSLLLPKTQRDEEHLAYLEGHATEFSRQDAPMLTLKREAKQQAEGETGVWLAKSYKESGVLLGDRGYLSYSSSTTSAMQEHRLPVFVAAFYDPGLLSIGNKCILVPPFVTETINASSSSFNLDKTESNGVLVWFQDIKQAESLKKELQSLLEKEGIGAYWKVTTFYDYDFAKDLMRQFQSDKALFTLVGVIILLVACCNIISLLALLVNDKKREIAILQAMGASGKSIATIFGFCGIAMGVASCIIGATAALFTLRHIDALMRFLSFIQGREAFNVAFFGSTLPKDLSQDALIFILIATPLLSLAAGLVPALKACRLRPSSILRSE